MSKLHPREPRRQTFIKAHMSVAGEWVEVGIANVSSTGLMVKFPGGPKVGMTVELRRRGMLITGEVVWWTATRFGVRSFEPIDHAALVESGLQTDISDMAPPNPDAGWHWRQTR